MSEVKEGSAKPKPLSLKSLDEKFNGLEEKLEAIISTLEARPEKTQGVPKPSTGPAKAGASGYKYKFVSKYQGLKQVLAPSHKEIYNKSTGEYEIVPPELALFGEGGPGPKGFWGTNSEEEAEKMRQRIKMKPAVEIIEVTDDPAYAHL